MGRGEWEGGCVFPQPNPTPCLMDFLLAWAPHVLTAGALFLAVWSRRTDQKQRLDDRKRDDERRVEEDRRWKVEREHEADRLRHETDGVMRSLEVERAKLQAEAQRWRDEKRDTKRAEIAGELAGAIQRFVIAMNTIADTQLQNSPPDLNMRSGGPNYRELPQLQQSMATAEYGDRWNAAVPTFNAFIDAWNQANVYLPTEVSELCSELWTFKADVEVNQRLWLATMGQPDSDPSALAGGVGQKVHDRAAELDEKALTLLRPLAQLGEISDATPVKPVPAHVEITKPKVNAQLRTATSQPRPATRSRYT